MNLFPDRHYAIELARKMKAADTRCLQLRGPDVETHGEWALIGGKTPRGGTSWTPGVFEKLERTAISLKYNGVKLGLDGLAQVSRTMGRSSDAVFQAMRKKRPDILRNHFSLEI